MNSKVYCIIFSGVLLLSSFLVQSQNRNSIWCFGDSAGIDFRNTSSPVPIATGLDTRGSCTSIADSSGNLLFYAATRSTGPFFSGLVYDKTHNVMLDGDSIHGEAWYNELLIIPFPGNESQYYLFSAVVLSPYYGVYFSVIDMSLNNGLGAVVQKNIQLNNLNAWDAMAAVKHGNGRDWWLITKDYSIGGSNGNNIFRSYLITPDSIHEFTQSIGVVEFGNAGNMAFSKNGNRFVFTTYKGAVEVLDFNRCTGIFSNPKIIYHNSSLNFMGSCFSSNSDFLYVSVIDTTSQLFQFDLNSPNIINSKVVLDTINYPHSICGMLRLAPDDKIYWSNIWWDMIHFNYPYPDSAFYTENMNLSVINNPNIQGIACNYSRFSFYLGGKRTYFGLPNNPDYEMGPLTGSICDSLTSSITEPDHFDITLYPNPARDKIYINGIEKFPATCKILSVNGQTILEKELNDSTTEINISALADGIYFLSVGNTFFRKFSVVK